MARTKPGATEGTAQTTVPLPANVEEASVPEVRAGTGITEESAAAQPVPEEARALSEEEQAEADAELSGKEMVRLMNAQHFEIRTITEKNWRDAGIEGGKTVHWHKGNGFQVPKSDLDFLDDNQFELIILGDGRFEVVTVE